MREDLFQSLAGDLDQLAQVPHPRTVVAGGEQQERRRAGLVGRRVEHHESREVNRGQLAERNERAVVAAELSPLDLVLDRGEHRSQAVELRPRDRGHDGQGGLVHRIPR